MKETWLKDGEIKATSSQGGSAAVYDCERQGGRKRERVQFELDRNLRVRSLKIIESHPMSGQLPLIRNSSLLAPRSLYNETPARRGGLAHGQEEVKEEEEETHLSRICVFVIEIAILASGILDAISVRLDAARDRHKSE